MQAPSRATQKANATFGQITPKHDGEPTSVYERMTMHNIVDRKWNYTPLELAHAVVNTMIQTAERKSR